MPGLHVKCSSFNFLEKWAWHFSRLISLLVPVLAQSAPALLPLEKKGNTNNRFTKYWVINVLCDVALFNRIIECSGFEQTFKGH